MTKKAHVRFNVSKLLAATLVLSTLTVATSVLVRGQGSALGDAVVKPIPRNTANELSMKITDSFTFAAVGDIIGRRPIGPLPEAGYQQLVKVIQGSDMAYANMEGPIMDPATFPYPIIGGGPSSVADDLKAMGIRIMTTANNHTMDSGAEGMYETHRLLASKGIVHAGSGKNLDDARRAAIAATPKGTVAAVGMYSIDPASSPARSRFFGASAETAGLNPLNVTAYNVVTAEQMKALRSIRDAVYARRGEVATPIAPVPPNEPLDTLQLFRSYYKVGPKAGSLSYEMAPNDLQGIIESIRVGKQLADFMIVAIHCHQNSFAFQAYSHDLNVPDFLVELAHLAIDNGADAFVGHGVHTVRGVEIYKGKPIFYGLSNFVYHEDAAPQVTDPSRPQLTSGASVQVHQSDNMEALLVTSRFEGGKLAEVRLYPADLGQDRTRPNSRTGIPMTPSRQMADRFLNKLQGLSKPFGTTIENQDGVGVIRILPPATN